MIDALTFTDKVRKIPTLLFIGHRSMSNQIISLTQPSAVRRNAGAAANYPTHVVQNSGNLDTVPKRLGHLNYSLFFISIVSLLASIVITTSSSIISPLERVTCCHVR